MRRPCYKGSGTSALGGLSQTPACERLRGELAPNQFNRLWGNSTAGDSTTNQTGLRLLGTPRARIPHVSYDKRIQVDGAGMMVQTEQATLARQQVDEFSAGVSAIRDNLHRVIVGQEETVDQLMICALTGSHALLVGVPGLAKTLIVKALASSFDWKFSRIQFTPDLMPSDITGYELLGRSQADGSHQMVFRRGPVFANLVLADEINRAAPKTQSALLESMAERHVTVGGETYPLDEPFFVVATQNPIEQEGTYPLPEAQLDRFMMEIRVGYPTPQQERQIVLNTAGGDPDLPPAVFSREDYLGLRRLVSAVPVADDVVDYAVSISRATRPEDSQSTSMVRDYVSFGVGPRGSQNLVKAAKARALLQGAPPRCLRTFVAWPSRCCGTG